ncbi:MAG TPA: hypothetical protein VF175_07775 [Lacipirellula sp.]
MSQSALSDGVTYENVDGVRYQVTHRTVQRQIPVTEYKPQQQTTYQQQVVTQNVQHQQVYSVPVTQYRIVSRLNGRWNPFVTPYWTHHYEPVTTYQTQVGTVQIPVTRVNWAPVTQTVQAPVTTYRTANETMESRVAIGPAPMGSSNTAIASNSPSATISPLGSAPAAATVASRPLGGEKMTGDPPREATGWQSPSTSRY